MYNGKNILASLFFQFGQRSSSILTQVANLQSCSITSNFHLTAIFETITSCYAYVSDVSQTRWCKWLMRLPAVLGNRPLTTVGRGSCQYDYCEDSRKNLWCISVLWIPLGFLHLPLSGLKQLLPMTNYWFCAESPKLLYTVCFCLGEGNVGGGRR